MNDILLSVSEDRVQLDIPSANFTVLLDLQAAETFLRSFGACLEQATWNSTFDTLDPARKAS